MIKLADFADNLRSFINIRKADIGGPYHNQYILWILGFLESCPDSNAKNLVFKLTEELEVFVTE